jgi:hypothetical protein
MILLHNISGSGKLPVRLNPWFIDVFPALEDFVTTMGNDRTILPVPVKGMLRGMKISIGILHHTDPVWISGSVRFRGRSWTLSGPFETDRKKHNSGKEE